MIERVILQVFVLLALALAGCEKQAEESVVFVSVRPICYREESDNSADVVGRTARVFYSEDMGKLQFTPYLIQAGSLDLLPSISMWEDWSDPMAFVHIHEVLASGSAESAEKVYEARFLPAEQMVVATLKGYIRVLPPAGLSRGPVTTDADRVYYCVGLKKESTGALPAGDPSRMSSLRYLCEYSKKHDIDFFCLNVTKRSNK